MNRKEARKISRDTWRKFGVGLGTEDANGSREYRRAGGFDINGNKVKGQRNQRPQRMAWVMKDDVDKTHVLLAPLNRALKRRSGASGKVREDV